MNLPPEILLKILLYVNPKNAHELSDLKMVSFQWNHLCNDIKILKKMISNMQRNWNTNYTRFDNKRVLDDSVGLYDHSLFECTRCKLCYDSYKNYTFRGKKYCEKCYKEYSRCIEENDRAYGWYIEC